MFCKNKNNSVSYEYSVKTTIHNGKLQVGEKKQTTNGKS